MSRLFIVGCTDRGVCLISWVRYSAEIRQGNTNDADVCYTCTYSYTHTYIHTHTHTYIHINVCTGEGAHTYYHWTEPSISLLLPMTKQTQPAAADRKHVRTQIQRFRWPKWKRAQWGYLSDRMESQHDFILHPFNRLQQVCNLHHHWLPAGGTKAISDPQRNLILKATKCCPWYDDVW